MDLNIQIANHKGPKRVPNQHPADPHADCRLAIIGEAPGEHEEDALMPFVGSSGQLLDRLLTQAGIRRSSCLVANVCQLRPPRNDIGAFSWTGPEIQSGLDTLGEEIAKWNPNLCLLLGKTAMRAAGYNTTWQTVNEWRGSLSVCNTLNSPLFGRKCLVTYHPAAVLRMYSWMPLFLHDIYRAREEMESSKLELPKRQFDVTLTASQIVDRLEKLRTDARPVALDIEGYTHSISCVSFANHPLSAFIVPMVGWPRSDFHRILRAMAALLGDPNVPKVLQNSLYDNLALSLTYQMPIRNVADDTMLGGWETYPELPKSLGTLASIHTREPAYKYQRKSDDTETHHRYCCTDSAVTLEISERFHAEMTPAQKRHYRFNVQLLKPFLYMELRGIHFDRERAAQLHGECLVRMAEVQKRLDVRLGKPININSPKQVCEALYDQLNFPVQHPKKTVGYGLDRTKRTSDVNALLKLCGQYRDSFLTDLLLFRKLEKERQFLEVGIDSDSRIRCSYSVVGTDTGRVSSSAQTRVHKENKIGTNLQTVTKKLRILLRADEGYEFFQCDLAGADGWTVAAHCMALGDSTMYDDYIFGLKPAKIVVLLQRHGSVVNTWSREKLKEESRDVTEEGPDGSAYFSAKVIQHGTSYKMGPGTMSNNITLQSYKKRGNPIYVSRLQCAAIQELFFSRYPGIRRWHNTTEFRIKQARGFPTMSCASGHIRTFFGRPTDDATIRSALSHEPQSNTTYATNLATYRLASDPENRDASGNFIIEPLHQVHDALCGQWPIELRDWAMAKVISYFQNELEIAGTRMIIPFDGQYGPSWGELKNEFKF